LDQWEDKNTHQKQSKLKVVLETFSFVDSNRGDASPVSRAPAPAAAAGTPVPASAPAEPEGAPVEEDDVPF